MKHHFFALVRDSCTVTYGIHGKKTYKEAVNLFVREVKMKQGDACTYFYGETSLQYSNKIGLRIGDCFISLT